MSLSFTAFAKVPEGSLGPHVPHVTGQCTQCVVSSLRWSASDCLCPAPRPGLTGQTLLARPVHRTHTRDGTQTLHSANIASLAIYGGTMLIAASVANQELRGPGHNSLMIIM